MMGNDGDRTHSSASWRVPHRGVFAVLLATAAFSQPVVAQNAVQANAAALAERVCLSPDISDGSDREGPCKKALIALESAGLQQTLVHARVQQSLGHIWADRGKAEVAASHYQSAIAFALSSSITRGERYEQLADLEIGSAGFCARSPVARLAIAMADLRQSWQASDDFATAAIQSFALDPGAKTAPATLNSTNFAARQMMVLLGGLFPQFNRPMDVPLLVSRLVSKSVPADDEFVQEPQIAFMEALFAGDRGHDAAAAQFIDALGRLEDATYVGEDDADEDERAEAITKFAAAHAAFRAVVPEVLTSRQLDLALQKRLPAVCFAGTEEASK